VFLVEGAYTHGLKNRDSILQGNIEVGVGDIDIHALQCHEHLLSKVELARGDCDPLERGVLIDLLDYHPNKDTRYERARPY